MGAGDFSMKLTCPRWFTAIVLVATATISSAVEPAESAAPHLPNVAQSAGLPTAPNLVLLYYGFDKNGARDWDVDALKYYLGYYENRGTERGKPVDTMFDAVLWMYRISSRGSLFETSGRSKPTREEDWRECLERLFLPGLQLHALEAAAAELERRLGRPVRVQVVLTLPYPDVRVEHWAERPDSPQFDFRTSDAPRLAAVQWYARAALDRWNAAQFAHLRLLGFYWFNEGHANLRSHDEVKDEALWTDVALIGDTARFVHTLHVDDRPLTLTWIPYSPYGLDRLPVVADLMKTEPARRIDYLMIQPNYFFARWKKERADLVKLVQNAASVGSGVEVEFDENLVKDEAFRQRFMDYLDVLQHEHPRWKSIPVGYYQGLRAVHALATHPDLAPQYEALYRFIKARSPTEP